MLIFTILSFRKLQARQAFATYLSRVQQRLLEETSRPPEKLDEAEQNDEQMVSNFSPHCLRISQVLFQANWFFVLVTPFKIHKQYLFNVGLLVWIIDPNETLVPLTWSEL